MTRVECSGEWGQRYDRPTKDASGHAPGIQARAKRRTRRTVPRGRRPMQAAGRVNMLTHPITGVIKRQAEVADELIKAGIVKSRKAFTSRLARWGNVPRAYEQERGETTAPDEKQKRLRKIYNIVKADRPMKVRQVYYQVEILGGFKSKNLYKMVAQDLVELRDKGFLNADGTRTHTRMPYDWIVDNSRQAIRPYADASVRAALEERADNYSVDLWKDWPCLVQVWVENRGYNMNSMRGATIPVKPR
jgi:hypothetical protein